MLRVRLASKSDLTGAYDMIEREFKRRIAERSGSLAVLCNDDKLESLASYPFLHAADLDYLICTRQDPVLVKTFEGEDCTVITAG